MLYQSVNRPEVERLIIPTEWIELGATFYGTYRKFSYALIVTHGPDLGEAQSPTWIRRGAETRFQNYGITTNGWVSYRGIPFTELVLGGYWSYTGSGRVIERVTGPERFWTNMGLLSLHARSDYRGFTAIALGAVGFHSRHRGRLPPHRRRAGRRSGSRAKGLRCIHRACIRHRSQLASSLGPSRRFASARSRFRSSFDTSGSIRTRPSRQRSRLNRSSETTCTSSSRGSTSVRITS